MNIKFKKTSEIDLSKVFPTINANDYALLEGQVIPANKKMIDQLNKDKYLDLGGYQISESLIEVINDLGVSEMQVEIQKLVDEKFIYSNEPVDVLIAGIESGRNVLLWGKGGHGKSEITELVLNELYKKGYISEPPFIQAFGDGLTEEKLFGGMDIKKYKEEGKIEYLPENSFMNHEVVVFEEIFDAPAQALLSLKDIMTSKRFRQGNEVFEVKTKVYIGLTNRSKREFADKDDSLAALAERFALTYKTEWKSYNKRDFIKLFNKVYGEDFYKEHKEKLNTLANICEMNNADGSSFISPRTAVAAADLFTRGKKLEYISDIDPDIIHKYESQILADERTEKQETLLRTINTYIEDNNLEFVDESEQFLKDLNAVEQEISGKSIDLNDLDFGNSNDREIKINKCKYVLAIIDRQTPTKSTFNSFSNLKKRVNGIVSTLSIDTTQTA